MTGSVLDKRNQLGHFSEANELLNDHKELVAAFQEDGYLFFRGVLDIDEVQRVKRDFVHVLQLQGIVRPESTEPVWSGAGLGKIDDNPLYDLPSYEELLSSTRLTQLLENFFRGPVFRYRNTDIRFALPHDSVHLTPPHQDHFFVRHTAEFCTAWIPVMNIEPAMGALALAAGSHRDGLREHVEHETAYSYIFRGRKQRGVPIERISDPWLTADFQAGDLLLFHSLMIHRALPNLSDRIRLSLDTRFQPLDLPRNWQSEQTIPEMRRYRKQAAGVATAVGLSEDAFENLLIEMMKRGVEPQREPMLALAAELAGQS